MFPSAFLLLTVRFHSHELTNKQILQNRLPVFLIGRSECGSWMYTFCSRSTMNHWSMPSTMKIFSVQQIRHFHGFLVLPLVKRSTLIVNVLFAISLLIVVSSRIIVPLHCPSQL